MGSTALAAAVVLPKYGCEINEEKNKKECDVA